MLSCSGKSYSALYNRSEARYSALQECGPRGHIQRHYGINLHDSCTVEIDGKLLKEIKTMASYQYIYVVNVFI